MRIQRGYSADTTCRFLRMDLLPLQELVRSNLGVLMSETGWGVVLFVMSLALSRGISNVQVRRVLLLRSPRAALHGLLAAAAPCSPCSRTAMPLRLCSQAF